MTDLNLSNLSKEVTVAIEAAKLGAKQANKYFNKELTVNFKPDQSPVTIADKESEEVIRTHILKTFPNAKFVGEELGGETTEKEFWVIDPIDGTKQFVRGIPHWAVLICLIRNADIVMGLCLLPGTGDVLWAEKGKGAFLNGKNVSVSKIDNFRKGFLCYGGLKHFKNKENMIKLMQEFGSGRGFDTSYNYFLLAIGKVDAALDAMGLLWDIAPFKVIIEEAGGKVTNLQGEEWTFTDRGCIATNGLLHTEVVKILNS